MRKKIDLAKYAPPGMDISQETGFFITGLMCAALYSMLFLDRYWDAYEDLWVGYKHEELFPGIQIEPFVEILEGSLNGYFLLAGCMLVIAANHYAYFRRGSKSIYLARRLPDRGYLRRVCWTLPLWGIGISLAAALISLGAYYALYINMTPWECLPR